MFFEGRFFFSGGLFLDAIHQSSRSSVRDFFVKTIKESQQPFWNHSIDRRLWFLSLYSLLDSVVQPSRNYIQYVMWLVRSTESPKQLIGSYDWVWKWIRVCDGLVAFSSFPGGNTVCSPGNISLQACAGCVYPGNVSQSASRNACREMFPSLQALYPSWKLEHSWSSRG